MAPQHLPLKVTLKGRSQGHQNFKALYLVKDLVRAYVIIKH